MKENSDKKNLRLIVNFNIAHIASYLSIIIGTIVLIGWQFDIELFKRISDTFIAMNPMTAVGFIFSGISLYYLTERPLISRAFSILVMLIALVKLISFITPINLQVDQWLFTDKIGLELQAGLFGPISPLTVLNFLIISIAFLIFSTKGIRQIISQIFALITLILSVYAFFTYYYNFVILPEPPFFFALAIHTSVTFIVLSYGMLIYSGNGGFIALINIGKLFENLFNKLSIKNKLIITALIQIIIVTVSTIYIFILINNYTVAILNQTRMTRIAQSTMWLFSSNILINEAVTNYIDTKDPSYRTLIEEQYNEISKNRQYINENLKITTIKNLFKKYELMSDEQKKFDTQILSDLKTLSTAQLRTLNIKRSDLNNEVRRDLKTMIDIEYDNLLNNVNNIELRLDIFYKTSVFVFLSSVGLIALLLAILRSSLTRSLSTLMLSAQKIANGDLDIEIPVTTQDEVGLLTETFNSMTKQLKKSFQNFEEAQHDLEKFKLAVDYASDQIVIADPTGIILYANSATSEITGYSHSELLGKKAGSSKLWGGQMDREFYAKLWHTIKIEKKTFEATVNNRRKNGNKYFAQVKISPVLDKNNNVVFLVAIERDISKEKEIDRAKSEFVSLASHQLRTPLTTINWYIEMLLGKDSGPLTAQQKKFINEVYSGSKNLVKLVNALLNVSRIEMGTFGVEPEKTDLIKLEQSVLAELKPLIVEKKHQIIEKHDTMPEVMVDPNLMRIIYQNLLTNAIKYTPQKGKISIQQTIEGTGDDRHILITVEDNGYGIPTNQQNKIYDKLFRADNARSKDTQGIGLGLYIVKSIIEKSGGTIRFESQENKGTKFYITLPLKGMEKKSGTKSLES